MICMKDTVEQETKTKQKKTPPQFWCWWLHTICSSINALWSEKKDKIPDIDNEQDV